MGWATFDLRWWGFPSRVHLAAQTWLFAQVFSLVQRSKPPRCPEQGAGEHGALRALCCGPALLSLSPWGYISDTEPCPQKEMVFRKPWIQIWLILNHLYQIIREWPAVLVLQITAFSWGCANKRFHYKTLKNLLLVFPCDQIPSSAIIGWSPWSFVCSLQSDMQFWSCFFVTRIE